MINVLRFLQKIITKKPTEPVLMSIKNFYRLEHKIPTKSLLLNGPDFKFLKEQTPEACLAAVKQTDRALEHVKNNTPELLLACVLVNPTCIRYIR